MDGCDSYPGPHVWHEIYKGQHAVWEEQGADPEDKPPLPVILGGWRVVSGIQKHFVWVAGIDWSINHGVFHELVRIIERESRAREDAYIHAWMKTAFERWERINARA